MQGMVEADVAYVNRRGEIQVVLGTDALQDTVYSLWRRWKEHLGTEQWRAIAYTVENGEFHMDLTYPDAFDEHEIDPRAKAIEKYFGKDKKVLYPRPSA
jgi:hypothetical protein